MDDPKTSRKPFSRIVEAIGRKKGSWVVAVHDGQALLAAGSINVVKAAGGFIVTLRLSRDELLNLRRAADEAIDALDALSPPH